VRRLRPVQGEQDPQVLGAFTGLTLAPPPAGSPRGQCAAGRTPHTRVLVRVLRAGPPRDRPPWLLAPSALAKRPEPASAVRRPGDRVARSPRLDGQGRGDGAGRPRGLGSAEPGAVLGDPAVPCRLPVVVTGGSRGDGQRRGR